MDESVFNVTQLSELELKDGPQAALRKCLSLDIPVFIRAPKNRTLWAIPNDYKQSISEYEAEENACSPFEKASITKQVLFPRSPKLISVANQLLQLNRSDTEALLAIDKIDVCDFSRVYSFDIDTGFKQIESVLLGPYPLENLKPFGSEGDELFNKEVPCSSEHLNFTLCNNQKTTIKTLSDPIRHISPIEIGLDDCFIPTKSVGQLKEYTVKDIPEKSPYYVPHGYRCLPKLCQLAVLGQQLYEDKSRTIPPNMANYLMAEFSIKKKEAESSAFFISPNPGGKMKAKFKGKIQFEHLIEALNDFDADKEVKDEKVKIIKDESSKSQYMEKHFLLKYGYADEKCTEAVRLVTL